MFYLQNDLLDLAPLDNLEDLCYNDLTLNKGKEVK